MVTRLGVFQAGSMKTARSVERTLLGMKAWLVSSVKRAALDLFMRVGRDEECRLEAVGVQG